MNLNKVYKCMNCGSVIERVNDKESTLVCCGKNMIEQKPKTAEMALEKHVPYITESNDGKVLIKIGENEDHPMTEEHYIEFIEILTNTGKIIRHNLNPGDKPEAKFSVDKEKIIEVREFCNIHGLWNLNIQ